MAAGSVILIIVIFIILALFLYYLSTCGNWVSNNLLILQALFSAAAFMYFVYMLFTEQSWVWKLIDIVIIILLIWLYWSTVRNCRYFIRA